MRTDLTRRECLGALTSAALLTRAPLYAASPAAAKAPSTPSGKPMRGAFMILSTPFTSSGEVDWEDLARELDFVDRCGCQGMVWPQGSSSVASLSKDERMRGMEVLAK